MMRQLMLCLIFMMCVPFVVNSITDEQAKAGIEQLKTKAIAAGQEDLFNRERAALERESNMSPQEEYLKLESELNQTN